MARARTPLALLLALIGLAAAAAPADALTRTQANKIALKVLKPKAADRASDVVVFGLPKPLGARDFVTIAGRPQTRDEKRGVKVVRDGETVKSTTRVRRLGRKTWLFWEDQAYGAAFGHPSRLLLVDDRTGRVRQRKTLSWWPVINGRDAPFIRRRGAGDARWRIHQSFRGALPSRARSSLITRAFSSADELKPNGLKGECVVMMFDEEALPKAGDLIGGYFGDRGATVFGKEHIKPNDSASADGNDLAAFIPKITRLCPDIIIYIAGHGAGDQHSTVTVGRKQVRTKDENGNEVVTEEDADVRGATITGIIRRNPNTKFKLIVDSCASGNFATIAGLTVGVSAASRGTLAKTGVDLGQAAGDFTVEFIEQMKAHEGEAAADTSGADKGARLIELAAATTDNFDKWHVLGLSQVVRRSALPPITTGAAQPPPTQPPPSDGEPPPTIKPIFAESTEGVTYTQYSVTVEALPGRGIDYAWSLTPPADDPGCNKLEQLESPRYARWHHGNADGCTHAGTNHNGTVKVVATVHWPEKKRDWICTATYTGTHGGTGPEPGPCEPRDTP